MNYSEPMSAFTGGRQDTSAILNFNPEPRKYSHIGIEEFTLDHTLQTEKITLSYAKSI